MARRQVLTLVAERKLAELIEPPQGGAVLERAGNRGFDLHPDGERFAVAVAAQTPSGTKQDKVVFIFNFFDELRRIAPATKR